MVYNSLRDHVLLPLASCVLCGSHKASGFPVCQACLQDLPAAGAGCTRCGHYLAVAGVCGQCQRVAPPFDRTLAAYYYRFPLDRLIVAGKFHARLDIMAMLGQLMVPVLAASRIRPDVIVPVPLHRRRLQERGYNQSLELARSVSGRLHIPVDDRWCRRIRNTGQQSLLPVNQRGKNVRGCFELDGERDWRHVAIIDDVMTTGQTVAALAGLLRTAGVSQVTVWTCCRAIATE